MKHLFTLFLFLAGTVSLCAQSLSLFDITTSGFPSMKAKFWAFDAAGRQERPSLSELTLTENGVPRIISNVHCTPPSPPILLSAVLTVDVSGSMNVIPAGTKNITLAKAAATAWIKGLPAGPSECALTSFNVHNYLNLDFTQDRNELLNALSSLSPSGETDYDMGLLMPVAGALEISKRGKYKKVIIFLSDGLPTRDPDIFEIIKEAKRQNCTIFAVTLGLPCPQSLQSIATQTGGEWFENVTTVQEAEEVYRRIMQLSQGSSPCEVTWTSDVSCSVDSTTIALSWQGLKSEARYFTPPLSIASLQVTPSFIAFGKQAPSIMKDTTLTITARNADFTITDIRPTFGSANFSVSSTGFPISIPKNSTGFITLRFAPVDSSMKFAGFEIVTDKCLGYIGASGGFPGRKIIDSTLKLTTPNGGEMYVVGRDEEIRWTGITPTDTVMLEYSITDGKAWRLIENSVSGLRYQWKKIPKPTSTTCLVRVSQIGSSTALDTNLLVTTLLGHTKEAVSVCFSPDGSTIATCGKDGAVILWDRQTFKQISSFTIYDMAWVTFSPDGSKLAAACYDATAKLWDVRSGQLLQTYRGHTEKLYCVAFNPAGSTIATCSSDGYAKIWDITTGLNTLTLGGATNGVLGLTYSPDGTTIALAYFFGDAVLYDAVSGTKKFSLIGHTDGIKGIVYSPDGKTILTSSWDKTAKIWDAATGIVLHTLTGHTSLVYNAAFSPDGSLIATVSKDGTIKLWNPSTGALIRTILGHTNEVWGVAFSPDGSTLATSSYDATVKLWTSGIAAPLQQDISDSVFSIVTPDPLSQDVDMLQCLVGTVRDSSIVSFLRNPGTYPYTVDSIRITGPSASMFTMVSGFPPFEVPAGTEKPVEFRFQPTSIGTKVAQVLIYVNGEIIRQNLRGEGIAPQLSVVNSIIDFGKIIVGTQKDTLRALTIKNIGTVPLLITSTYHAGPNATDFSTRSGGGSFTLAPNTSAEMDLRFSATKQFRTSGRLLFDYNGVGSPATVQLFGEGIINIPDTARTTVIAQDITAQAGEKVNLSLKLYKPSGMNVIGAPTEWFARIHYNKSILFNEQTSNVCPGTTDSCVLELTGVYNPKSDELISIPCSTTLGNTDHSTIVIDTFYWTNSAIVTEVATQDGSITLNGICDDGGVRLFIPAKNSTSLSSRPNPAQDKLQIQYGLREPLTVTLELLTMTGQVVQTILNNQAQAAGQYTLTSDLSALGNGVYLLRLRTNKEMLTARVDVVK